MKALKVLKIIIAVILLAFIVVLIFTPFDIVKELNEIIQEYEEYVEQKDPFILGIELIINFVSNFIKLVIIFFMILVFLITFSNVNSIKRGKGKLFLFFALFYNLLFMLVAYSIKFSVITQSFNSLFSDLNLVTEFLAFIYFTLLSVYCILGIVVSKIRRKKIDNETDKLSPAEPDLNTFTRALGVITMIYFFASMAFLFLMTTFLDLVNYFTDTLDQNVQILFAFAVLFLAQFIITIFSLMKARKGKGIILFIEIFVVSIFIIFSLMVSIANPITVRLIIYSFVPFAYSIMGLIGTLRIRRELKDNDVIEPQTIEVKEKPSNPASFNYW